jgi:hypothetical protein
MTFCFAAIMAPQHWCQEVECGQEAGTHQYIRGGTLPSIWWQGHLDLQWLPLQRAGSWLGARVSPGLSPLNILCRSAPPVHHGIKFRIQSPIRWGPLRAAMRPWCLLSFSLLLVRSWTYRLSHKYRYGCITWFNDFSLQPQSEFFTIICDWLLEIYLWGEPPSPVTLSPPWYTFW